ncbi:MAG: YihY/virulence factor BrkB family protein [Oligosphaeraceae bacterium]
MSEEPLRFWLGFRPVNFLVDFFTRRIWNADFRALRFLKRELYSLCRLLMVAGRGVFEDRCTLQSCALTYITMVSLVPVLAIALSFCKGMGLQAQLLEHLGIETLVQKGAAGGEETLVYRVVPVEEKSEALPEREEAAGEESEALAPQAVPRGVRPGFAAQLPEPVQEGILKIIGYVDKTNFAALGIVGVITLVCTVVMSIQKLENSFNDIWCVRRGRSLMRQVSEYLVVLLLLPILLSAILSLNAFINSGNLAAMLHTQSRAVLYWGHFLARFLLFFFLVLSFAALYLFMPNTRVRLKPALLSGAVAAVAWGVVLLAYIRWQIGLARYNAIYGAFAALPFFLAWLYANWMVILLGAELCYAAQNQRLLRQTKQMRPVEAGANRLLGIAIVEAISRCYDEGRGCWNAARFAMENNISIRELEFCLESLTRAGLVIQRMPEADPPESYDYILGRPAAQITLSQVSDAFMGMDSETARRISRCLPEGFVTFMRHRHEEQDRQMSAITFQHGKGCGATVACPEGGEEEVRP